MTSWPHGGTPDSYWSQPIYRSRDRSNTSHYAGVDPILWMVATDSFDAAHGVAVAVGVDGVVYAAIDDAVYTLTFVPRRRAAGRR